MKTVATLIVCGAIITGLTGCAGGPSKGTVAEDFAATDSAGETVTLSEFSGDVVVLDFFATWCAPCVKASPHVDALHERWKDNESVQIIAVHYDTNYSKGHPADHAKERGYRFTVIPDGSAIIEQYGVRNLPAFFILDQSGEVIHKQWNFKAGDVEKFSRIIDEALAGGG